MSDSSSFHSFLKKQRKLKKHQIQQYHAEELLKLRNIFKTEVELSHTELLKVDAVPHRFGSLTYSLGYLLPHSWF
jgi:hypothetical protein